jgi:hypothetical protein
MKTFRRKRLSLLILAIALMSTAQADDHRSKTRQRSHNYILERQQAYQVQGVPTSRLIIGKREIDIYPNGAMFERGNLVGFRSR